MSEAVFTPRRTVYERLAEASVVGSRPLGMIAPELFGDAVLDINTVTVTLENEAVPALVPIEYAEGYEHKRCHEIAGEADPGKVLYYSLPLRAEELELTEEMGRKLAEKDSGYVFYDYVGRNRIPSLLQDALDYAGHIYNDFPLLDSEAEVGNEQASITLYGFDFPVEDPRNANPDPSMQSLYEVYKKGVAEGKYVYTPDNGAMLIRGDEISDELFGRMWAVYKDRFQWLGEKHPVSMEDTEEEFATILRNPQTLASVCFQDGMPLCFTYLSANIGSLYWLNIDFLNNREKMHMSESQGLVFFPGIVSSEKGAGLSVPVISLLARAAFDSMAAYKVIFENTNRSERYIPRLVQTIINRVGRVAISAPEILDRTIYGCLYFTRGNSITPADAQ